MNRMEIYNKLMKAKKNEIADLCAGLIDLLSQNQHSTEDTTYRTGWCESRQCILEIYENELNNILK